MQQLTMFEQATQPTAKPTRKPPRGGVIYEPKGRAREYAALACNVYAGCDHQCTYCYAPSATRKARTDFEASKLRPQFLAKLEKDAARFETAGVTGRVLLSFTCDPYQHLDVTHQITRQTIATLHRHGFDVEVLTKGGSRALRDLDLFTAQDAFATTLTLLDDTASSEWEPRAAAPTDRFDTIRRFHAAGIPTWVSLEPVLDPAVALEIVRQTHTFVDVFKVGTLNYHPHAKTIDWPLFAHDSVSMLTSLGYHHNTDPDTLQSGDFYVKRDLARFLSK